MSEYVSGRKRETERKRQRKTETKKDKELNQRKKPMLSAAIHDCSRLNLSPALLYPHPAQIKETTNLFGRKSLRGRSVVTDISLACHIHVKCSTPQK